MFVTELKLAEGDSDIDLTIEGVKHEVSLRDNAAGTQFLNFFLFTIFFFVGGGGLAFELNILTWEISPDLIGLKL